jgi:hypothetical protein
MTTGRLTKVIAGALDWERLGVPAEDVPLAPDWAEDVALAVIADGWSLTPPGQDISGYTALGRHVAASLGAELTWSEPAELLEGFAVFAKRAGLPPIGIQSPADRAFWMAVLAGKGLPLAADPDDEVLIYQAACGSWECRAPECRPVSA